MASLTFDLAAQPLRQLNYFLHHELPAGELHVLVKNPDGAHSIAVGVNAPIDIEIEGHAGYYAAGMNQQARVKPVYETLEGWNASTAGKRSWADLPAQAIKYVKRVEELIECPVTLLSTSPERDDTILMRDPFLD